MIKFGGLCSLVAGVAFIGVFSYLAANFNYPDILDGDAYQVLPRIVAGGAQMRAVWALYAFLPLLLLPAALGVYAYLKNKNPILAVAGLPFAAVSALANMLGLMRWPSIHWTLAQRFVTATAEQQASIDAIFQGLNSYLGNYIGEFLGELTLNAWFLTIGLVLMKAKGKLKYFGYLANITAVLGFIGAFRNVTTSVAMVSEVNNYLLPAFLIALGIVMIKAKKSIT